jgi:2-C-methyl-D-erythritol 4-phosphate cytidylyltransferase / 2-C-methyl-D-erythritol 2,4-cyclodiphosphate synthase
MSELVAVLVAAGQSRRMGADKLWIDLWGRPVWRWSLDQLLAVPMLARVCVVVPAASLERFRAALPEAVSDRCLLTAGGETRADSVRAGLGTLTDAGVARDALVLVHDAARPAASSKLIEEVVVAAQAAGAAIPVLSVADTLKAVRDGFVESTVGRDDIGTAQTPQAASLGILTAASEAARSRHLDPTDEASALAALGVPVQAVPGDPANRKLTEPGDLPILRSVLRERCLADVQIPTSAIVGAGLGFDAHRYEARKSMRLGGVAFPDEAQGLAGHSDGDVVLHAVIDAVLGGAHMGDIGSLFPSDDGRWEGADSADLVRDVLGRLHAAGLRVRSVDVTVVGQHPRIAPMRQEMEGRIAALLECPAGAVSVKGTTSDGLGFTAGEGMAAYAIATVEPLSA